MENLFKQMRVRFSGGEQDSQQDLIGTRDRRIPPQKTSSFKGDRKKQQNWLRRQFTSETSRNYDSSDGGEYATAIAATAFAINSLEEAGLADKKRIREGMERFPTKTKSKKEEGSALQLDTGRISRRFTGKESKEDEQSREEEGVALQLGTGSIPRKLTSKKSKGDEQSREEASAEKSERVDQEIPENAVTSEKKPEKAPSRVPTIRRTPTITAQVDTQPRPIPPPPPTKKPTLPIAGDDEWKGNPTRAGGPKSKADAWMEAQMQKIKTRYEKMNSVILSWEDEKKKKAERQLNRKESELDRRRARVLEEYRNEMTRIDQIVGGARAQVEEKRRNEELKAKEKANKIRTTGKVPSRCFCC